MTVAIIEKIRRRLASDAGFTMIELLIVMQIVSILTLIGVPSYLTFKTKAQQATAQSNVRGSVPAAERWYADSSGGNGSYAGLMRSKLMVEATGIDPNVKAVALNSGAGYCVESTSGIYSYDYIGGSATPLGTWKAGKIQAATCLTAAGAAALAT
jgi:prepilin-type N-terminal cleavage/methylation domain-containing protein